MDMKYPEEFVKRFWARVRKNKKCWVWTGYRAKTGYGMVQCRGIQQMPMYTHRISWELANGAVRDGLHVLHSCDNPPCVRVSHLFLGTQVDNNDDRQRKGRTASGNRNGARTMPWRNPFIRKYKKKGR